VPASRSLALLLAAAGIATGCGPTGSNSSTGFTGPKKDVAKAVEDLEAAARKSDESKICTNLLSSELIGTIRAAGQSCTQAISHALDDADTFDLTVKSVTVSGNTATAVVESKKKTPKQDTFKLVKEGGGWKIGSLGAAPGRTVASTTTTTTPAATTTSSGREARRVCPGEPRLHFRLGGTPCKIAVSVFRGWTLHQKPPGHWICQAAGCDNVAGKTPQHIDWVAQ
jgi:hypothetical protein